MEGRDKDESTAHEKDGACEWSSGSHLANRPGQEGKQHYRPPRCVQGMLRGRELPRLSTDSLLPSLSHGSAYQENGALTNRGPWMIHLPPPATPTLARVASPASSLPYPVPLCSTRQPEGDLKAQRPPHSPIQNTAVASQPSQNKTQFPYQHFPYLHLLTWASPLLSHSSQLPKGHPS